MGIATAKRRIRGLAVVLTLLASHVALAGMPVTDMSGIVDRARKAITDAANWMQTKTHYFDQITEMQNQYQLMRDEIAKVDCAYGQAKGLMQDADDLRVGIQGLRGEGMTYEDGLDTMDETVDEMDSVNSRYEKAINCLTDETFRTKYRKATRDYLEFRRKLDSDLEMVNENNAAIGLMLKVVDARTSVDEDERNQMADAASSGQPKVSGGNEGQVEQFRGAQARARVRMNMTRRLQERSQEMSASANDMRAQAHGQAVNNVSGGLQALQTMFEFHNATVTQLNAVNVNLEAQTEMLVALVEIEETRLEQEKLKAEAAKSRTDSGGGMVAETSTTLPMNQSFDEDLVVFCSGKPAYDPPSCHCTWTFASDADVSDECAESRAAWAHRQGT